MPDPARAFGQHYLVELIGCPPEKIRYVEDVKPVLLRAAEESQATIVECYFKQYEPEGVTGVILIAESHFSIHTWPEEGFAAFDVLTCGEMLPEKAIAVITREFCAQRVKQQMIVRGY